MTDDTIVLRFEGGIGKHVMGTSLVRWVNTHLPESRIVVVSACPEVFEYNPRIWRNISADHPYAFEDYIKDNDHRMGDPYTTKEYYRDKMHYCKILPKAYGFGEYDDDPQTEIFLASAEVRKAQEFRATHGPFLTFQPYGGVASPETDVSEDFRMMPNSMAAKIAALLSPTGRRIIQVKKPKDPSVNGTGNMDAPFRTYLSLASVSDGHVGIDSSMMHATACFKRPMLTFWSSTLPKNLGYSYEQSINRRKGSEETGRPVVGMSDNAGSLPFRTNDATRWDYDDSELKQCTDDFIQLLQNRNFI